MLKIKENMSSHLRIWLASIPSVNQSYIGFSEINGKPYSYNNLYVDVDDVIVSILASVLGKESPLAMIEALRKNSTLPNREFLDTVANKLQDSLDKGEAIAYEFFTRFNLSRNDMLMLKYGEVPIKDSDNRILKDENGNPIFELDSKVINVNRNDVQTVIRQNWKNSFNNLFNLNSEESFISDSVSIENLGEIYKRYQEFKSNITHYFDENGELKDENSRVYLINQLKSLLLDVGIEINTVVANDLINGYSEIGAPKLKFTNNKNNSIFEPKNTGSLGTIFENLNPNKLNPEAFFNSSGVSNLSRLMEPYTNVYLTMSSRDAKNRSITAYSLKDNFTQNFLNIVNQAQDLSYQKTQKAKGQQIQISSPLLDFINNNDFKASSQILNYLTTLEPYDLQIFLRNFVYNIYNVSKNTDDNYDPKELPEMEPMEFLHTQMLLLLIWHLQINGITLNLVTNFLQLQRLKQKCMF